MELKRDEVIKALECCGSNNPCGEECFGHDIKGISICTKILAQNALSLINELTEENERLKQERMNKIDIYKALDILDKFDFFQGQRAGRELWAEKPFETQEEDLKNFSKDVELLKNFVEDIAHKLKCAELQIECKERICESYMLQYGTVADKEVWLKKERADTVLKYGEKVYQLILGFVGETLSEQDKDYITVRLGQIAKEMSEGV